VASRHLRKVLDKHAVLLEQTPTLDKLASVLELLCRQASVESLKIGSQAKLIAAMASRPDRAVESLESLKKALEKNEVPKPEGSPPG
jgi:hypothetical protein